MGKILYLTPKADTPKRGVDVNMSTNNDICNLLNLKGVPLLFLLDEGDSILTDINKIIYGTFKTRFKESIFTRITHIWNNKEDEYVFFQYSCSDTEIDDSTLHPDFYKVSKCTSTKIRKFNLEIFEKSEINRLFWSKKPLSSGGNHDLKTLPPASKKVLPFNPKSL